ncbi:peptidyl-prolyl cis-trans isomerase [Candidatus Bathyarchaeota archaeon]|nr:peptidyl-prolyl cis-trans isomerase [Candidatus Bathyarchaeota archaeon]
MVVFETNRGIIEVELYRDKAPLTVENFIKYVKEGHYNNTVFHRVISTFVIQGGGFTPNGTEKDTHAPIKLETNVGLSNKAGTIAMARTSSPNSATSQFFINLMDNSDSLDYRNAQNPGYAVFGKVVKGMDIVNLIGKTKTGTKNIYLPQYNITIPYDDWPIENELIIKAYLK